MVGERGGGETHESVGLLGDLAMLLSLHHSAIDIVRIPLCFVLFSSSSPTLGFFVKLVSFYEVVRIIGTSRRPFPQWAPLG